MVQRMLPPSLASISSAPMRQALGAIRTHLIGAAVFSALVNLLYIAPTIYMLQIYDRVVPTQGELTLLFITAVLLFALATLALLDNLRSRLLVRASLRLERVLATTLLETTLANRGGTGEVLSKQALREFDVLRQTLTGPALIGLFDAPWIPIYILVCLLIHPWLGLLTFVGALAVLVIAWLNEQTTRDPLERASEAASRSYVSLEQSMAGAEVIRALGMKAAMVERHLGERAQMLVLQAGAGLASARFVASTKCLRLTLQSLALGLGALLAIDNAISAGAIFAAAFLLGRALAPVDQLVGGWRQLVQARTAYATVNGLLSGANRGLPPTSLPRPDGRLSVEHAFVLTPSREAAILADVSFEILPGEVVAVVGPSGAGKSTLARTLAGAVTPERGVVRVDGASLLDWDQQVLARYIGYLPQEPSLFAGTVKENIGRFAMDVPAQELDDQVVEAARSCGAHEMILRLSSGYDTLLGWGGRGLSAGQAQRIALARALFRKPSVVILDEPNAHLDAEGEATLVQTLNELKGRKATVIIIAHRMGIMPAVDKILLLANGRIEGLGTRDDMLARLQRARPAQIRSVGHA